MFLNLQGYTRETILEWSTLVIVLFIAGVILLSHRLGKYFRERTIKKFAINNPQNIGYRQVDFDDDKITIRTNAGTFEHRYSAFIKVEESEEYYYAFLGKQTAVIFPKRIAEKTELLDLIQRIKTRLN